MATTPNADAEPAARRAYYDRIARYHLGPLWEEYRGLLTPEPRVDSQAFLWRYADIRPQLLEAADLISAQEAERRVLFLRNPGQPGEVAVTGTLYAGVQLVMPGEIAPAHRHSPSALRFVLEGSRAYTAVEGEKAWMAPGDFITTPNWRWHEHGNEGDGPVIWLDVLDVPIVRQLGAIFMQTEPAPEADTRPPDDSLYRFGSNLLPDGLPRDALDSPLVRYPYDRARAALEHLQGASELDPCHGIRMEYVNPVTGGPVMATLSSFLQWLPAGFETRPYQSTAGAVFSVIEGEGQLVVGEGDARQTFDWAERDIFVVPCWHRYRLHAARDSVLFSASDKAIQTRLGLWRERR